VSGTPPASPRGSALLAAVLVVLAAASVATTRPAGRSGLPPAAAATSSRLVTGTDLGCPDRTAAAAGEGGTSSLRVGLAGVSGRAGGGRVTLAPGGRSVVIERGRVLDVAGPDVGLLRGRGRVAAGLFGFRTEGRTHRGRAPTLAVASCAAPRAQWWFTGAGAGLDHTSTLQLTNLDPDPAVVDLRVLGPDGDVDTAAARGVVLPPGSRRSLALAGVAPGADDLALGVHATRGRVVASVTDAVRTRSGAPAGREWLPGVERGSRTLWLAGVPAAGNLRTGVARTLLVANPSELEAVVDVAVSDTSGTFTPTGVHDLAVAPGALARVDLTRALGDEPVAVRLRSGVPVLASLRCTQAGDESYAVPATALTGPAAAPVVPGVDATVELTAGTGAAARAEVAAYGAGGRRLGGAIVAVPVGGTTSWHAPPRAAYLVVTPASRGAVQGAVAYVGGGVAATPLVDLPLREQRVPVAPGPP
jgi:Family of unknown function (DUF5719)